MKHFKTEMEANGIPGIFRWVGYTIAAFAIYFGFLLKKYGYNQELAATWATEGLIALSLFLISYARETPPDELRGIWRYIAMWPSIITGIVYVVVATPLLRIEGYSLTQMPATEAVILTLLVYHIILFIQKRKFS